MGIQVVLSCSMCGAEKTVPLESDKLPLDTKSFLELACKSSAISGHYQQFRPFSLESWPWIVQHNKPHFDVYCCKKCAE